MSNITVSSHNQKAPYVELHRDRSLDHWFYIYLNDLLHALCKTKAIVFGDETYLCASNLSLPALYREMNSELSNLEEWFKCCLNAV